ncbi:MAG: zf-TFIIB domain-containing protein [Rhodobacteraceae bacterium]|nr:zf-TFIIB domain-containing protein [Paracoccaceae bacterium]
MKCPVDGTTLMMTHRSEVEIDYCPTCRGVWLDRGELDKILARAMAEAGPPVALRESGRGHGPEGDGGRHVARDDGRGSRGYPFDDDDDDDRDRYRRGGGRKRRESFLSDLFDF